MSLLSLSDAKNTRSRNPYSSMKDRVRGLICALAMTQTIFRSVAMLLVSLALNASRSSTSRALVKGQQSTLRSKINNTG
jgi:hypothetical protein